MNTHTVIIERTQGVDRDVPMTDETIERLWPEDVEDADGERARAMAELLRSVDDARVLAAMWMQYRGVPFLSFITLGNDGVIRANLAHIDGK